MKAIIFIRSNARKGNVEHGHVGWAFELKDKTFMAGSIEDVDISKRWSIKTNQPLADFSFGNGWKYPTYDMYKIVEVANPNIDSTLSTLKDVMATEYNFIGKNCMDATYKILKNYGAVIPNPADFSNWLPTEWFRNINATPMILMQHKHKIDFSIYEHPNCEGDSLRYCQNDNFDTPNIHYAGRELGDYISSIVLRSGKIRIFEHPNYEGSYLDLTEKGLYNLKDTGIEDKMSSFQAFV